MQISSGDAETAYLSLGGNLGEPERAMASALQMLDGEANVQITSVSSLYRTPPWGKLDQPDFLNIAAQLSTTLAPHALLDLCLDIERRLKRVRGERWGPRLIDIDILVFGDRVIHEDGLEVPHPRMLQRAFVLAPMAEIAPDLVVAGERIAERLRRADTGGIERLPSGQDWWRAA
nr:2-amino-4-hydroxy-6-hydroxymethyldihydropteridine diphosphokinase [Pseudaminobacter manganicus]